MNHDSQPTFDPHYLARKWNELHTSGTMVRHRVGLTSGQGKTEGDAFVRDGQAVICVGGVKGYLPIRALEVV